MRRQSAIADVILIALIGGPILAPFLATLKIFPFPLISTVIYFMGEHICPQPEMGLVPILYSPIAVCMRCYGVLLALVTTRFLYAINRGNGFYWLNQYRFWGAAIASILTFAYPIEMIAQILSWWSYNNYIVTGFGYLTGIGIGLFAVPVIYNCAN